MLNIIVTTWCVLQVFDVLLYTKVPWDFRTNYWWRFLPLGGLAVWIYWKLGNFPTGKEEQ